MLIVYYISQLKIESHCHNNVLTYNINLIKIAICTGGQGMRKVCIYGGSRGEKRDIRSLIVEVS